MRITYIRPAVVEGVAHDALQPLVFAILAGLTPGDVEQRLWDDRIEAVPLDEPTDLAVLTVETFTARRAWQLAAAYRERGIPVVVGGVHPTLRPAEALEHADAVVLGDAESAWPQVVADARRGRLQRRYEGRFTSLAGLAFDRRIFAGKAYQKAELVQFARGCRFACDFCSIRAFYGDCLRHRPVNEVAAEVAALRGRHLFFTDDNLFVSPTVARELCAALAPLRVRWACQVSLDVAADRDLVRRMARAGCRVAIIGFESLDPDNLKQMRKAWNVRFGQYARLARVFRDHGIMVWGSFVFGYDHDTPASFEAALELAQTGKFVLANFNALTPTPGTPLYERLAAQGRLLYPRWWLDPDYRFGAAIFQPARMSPEALDRGCQEARLQFNRWTGIGRRLLDPRANLRSPYNAMLFLLANRSARAEIRRKHGQRLG